MIDESKVKDESLELSELEGDQSIFNFQTLYAMLVLNWQWYLLSLFICLCGALIYLRYATPVYQVSAKMLIKGDDNRSGSAEQVLSSMQTLGVMSNSSSITNEMEIIKSRFLAHDVVKDLKLYVQYYSSGRLKQQLMYKAQPVSVDLDSVALESWDKGLQEGVKSISLSITKLENSYQVEGELLQNGASIASFSQELAKLPAPVKTNYGVLTLTPNGNRVMAAGEQYFVTIMPPMLVASSYAGALKLAQMPNTSIVQLAITDLNTRRGMDYLRELVICYNRQANIDKNEIAMKTEAFINGRLEKIEAELGSTESALENYKKQHAVIDPVSNASESLSQSSEYETKLTEANTQIQLMEYLREFVDNPANQYKIIPSNIGLTDPAAISLIGSYNHAAQERNR